MSHYTKDYSGFESETAKRKQALADIKDYLGVVQFKKICLMAHKDTVISRRDFIIGLEMFQGIEGYPAEAWADELGLV